MSKLNKVIIFLISKELQYDFKSIYSYLFINKTWCEMSVPILWCDPKDILIETKKHVIFYLMYITTNNLGLEEVIDIVGIVNNIVK
jgi:hypothetical protein